MMRFNKPESTTRPYPLAARAIKRNCYMDDFGKSAATDEEVIDFYQQLKQSSRNWGFNLTKWLSNSIAVVEFFGVADRTEKTIK